MPNFLDCPRELRDLCYKAYFESTLQEGHDKFVDTFPITWSNRATGLEAVEVAISVVTGLLVATESELEKAALAQSKATHVDVTAVQPVTMALYKALRQEYLRRSRYKQEVERRRGKQSAIASRLRRRLRWLKDERE